ncbi:unnamed protein product (macronuclear) [Paramecium tetraurelia]|uniref:Transmembrane protein n=1 Tax=Paramecium tetraurelia TaxID=5888 RepID=A0CZF1_PARTE|nr:uncharacterized protein GSPATT00011741001 [Paramecium tetraurelia]CAK76168.1 unnamed protein product [Paramecium tetraurelia]|eukprot:XP_001443565.1 hypothetical protein (macronuclear) [Paramecium tetraurelia strain d4-2]
MEKQHSVILTIGVLLSLLFSSKFDANEGTVNIKLTLSTMSWILISLILVVIQHLYTRRKIPSQPQQETIQEKMKDIDSPMRPRKEAALMDEQPTLSKEDSCADMGESLKLRSTQSQQDFDQVSMTSSLRKRSNSIASEGFQRKVSFDESQNKVHTYKKNNKLEIRNFESSFQAMKQEKKKKNELVKQKRKEENFKKLNINDINKKGRKRKSSLDENLSQSSY